MRLPSLLSLGPAVLLLYLKSKVSLFSLSSQFLFIFWVLGSKGEKEVYALEDGQWIDAVGWSSWVFIAIFGIIHLHGLKGSGVPFIEMCSPNKVQCFWAGCVYLHPCLVYGGETLALTAWPPSCLTGLSRFSLFPSLSSFSFHSLSPSSLYSPLLSLLLLLLLHCSVTSSFPRATPDQTGELPGDESQRVPQEAEPPGVRRRHHPSGPRLRQGGGGEARHEGQVRVT